jgi:hypothetical protein
MVKGFLLTTSNRPSKKYKIMESGAIGQAIHFGDSKYEDYTVHKNEARKHQYLLRHQGEYETFRHKAGFWARWILWNKPTIQESIQDIQHRFPVRIFIA